MPWVCPSCQKSNIATDNQVASSQPFRSHTPELSVFRKQQIIHYALIGFIVLAFILSALLLLRACQHKQKHPVVDSESIENDTQDSAEQHSEVSEKDQDSTVSQASNAAAQAADAESPAADTDGNQDPASARSESIHPNGSRAGTSKETSRSVSRANVQRAVQSAARESIAAVNRISTDANGLPEDPYVATLVYTIEASRLLLAALQAYGAVDTEFIRRTNREMERLGTVEKNDRFLTNRIADGFNLLGNLLHKMASHSDTRNAFHHALDTAHAHLSVETHSPWSILVNSSRGATISAASQMLTSGSPANQQALLTIIESSGTSGSMMQDFSNNLQSLAAVFEYGLADAGQPQDLRVLRRQRDASLEKTDQIFPQAAVLLRYVYGTALIYFETL